MTITVRHWASPETEAGASVGSTTLVRLRKCLWLYIALVFLEGPIRKWVVPQAATALLLARDPVVLAATVFGIRLGLLKGSRFLSFVSLLGFVSVIVSLLVDGNLPMTLYGWRSNFFHIPVAFLVARTFTARDLELICAWILRLALPMGLLMAIQFHSPPASWINAGLDQSFEQIGGLSDGLIRPPGTFSFITGPATYFPLVIAFMLAPCGKPSWQQAALRGCALAGVAMGTVFSGSRGLWVGELIVLGAYLLASAWYKPVDLVRKSPALLFLAILGPIFLANPSVSYALSVFTDSRVGSDSQQQDFLLRIANSLLEPLAQGYSQPLFGSGLGVGTTVGAILHGYPGTLFAFGDAETELLRHFIESGIIVGGLYVLLRFYSVITLLWMSARAARAGSLTPILLWAAAGPLILSGQVGQSTALGMTVIGTSFVLLALKAQVPDGA